MRFALCTILRLIKLLPYTRYTIPFMTCVPHRLFIVVILSIININFTFWIYNTLMRDEVVILNIVYTRMRDCHKRKIDHSYTDQKQ